MNFDLSHPIVPREGSRARRMFEVMQDGQVYSVDDMAECFPDMTRRQIITTLQNLSCTNLVIDRVGTGQFRAKPFDKIR